MSRYPDTVQFDRLNRPIGIEWTQRNLEVQGSIPAEINGAFFRAVHVPSQTPGHAGWLLCVIDHEVDFQHHESELFVLQADRLSAPPVARVKMPVALRPQVHGWWVSAAELANSKQR